MTISVFAVNSAAATIIDEMKSKATTVLLAFAE